MFALEMFIPVADNAGEEFQAEHDQAFEAFVLDRFGGLSRLPGEVDGAWLEAGVTYHDQNRVYLIAVRSILDGAKVGEVVEFARVHYRQLAIFVRYLGQIEIL